MVVGSFPWLAMGNHQKGENHQPASVSTDGTEISGYSEALAVAMTGSQMRGNQKGGELPWKIEWPQTNI